MDLHVAITGHVDHGKSTLIGRLLYDTDSLPDGKAEEIVASSLRRGDVVEWSYAVDAAQEERDQAITIETTRVWLTVGEHRIVIIDTPGHREFIKNMMSGAADADAAVLVIDAVEGIRDQTRRHAYLLQLLDVPEIVVAVNKIDAVADAAARYAELCDDARALLAQANRTPYAIVPISARDGDNVARRSERTAWYAGPTILEALSSLHAAPPPLDRPLRFLVQDVYRRGEERIAVGRVDAGRVVVGDHVRLAPSGVLTTVRSIERWPGDESPASAGESVGLTFTDPVFVDRGDTIAHAADAAPTVASSGSGVFFWLSSDPPKVGETVTLRTGTAELGATIVAIEQRIDLGLFDKDAPLDDSPRHAAFALRLRAARTLAVEVGARCVLQRSSTVVAGGKMARVDALASRDATVYEARHAVATSERFARYGYRGVVGWLTGLPASGKSTLAMAVERELFSRGYQVYALDGDNVRFGLNADLGFDRDARRENVRRLGEVGALFAQAGVVALVSAISPFAEDRARAREAAKGAFLEIYVRAGVEACAARDPKGLYKRAAAGELTDFTGVTAPYEAPTSPDVVVDTERESVEACAAKIVDALIRAAAVELEPTGAML